MLTMVRQHTLNPEHLQYHREHIAITSAEEN